ncbi:zonular occludens toxin domain-containing protein [Lysinibacillus sp. 54212]|uniref:zonular occludens toxin domain-containing protein n=1 Tax=Lysinibacillus sp. 54212 TaxID=3119829 RepID=UPI002FC8C324
MAHHIFFEGGLGSGKTFFMTALANLWRDQTNRMGGNVQLFSNYGARGSHPMDDFEAWYEVANAWESIVMWDEAQMAFNNRNWSSTAAQIATEVMFYTRKMQSIQMYASPSIANVDSRIRQIVEVLFHCRKVGNKGFEALIFDYQTKRFLRRVFMPMSTAKRLFKLNLYDTYSMVRGFPLPQNKKEIEEFWDTVFDIHQMKHRRGNVDANKLDPIVNRFTDNADQLTNNDEVLVI